MLQEKPGSSLKNVNYKALPLIIQAFQKKSVGILPFINTFMLSSVIGVKIKNLILVEKKQEI